MSDWQTVVALHGKVSAFINKHNFKPTILAKGGNSVPDSLHNRMFSFGSGTGKDSHDNDILIIGIEENINDKFEILAFFYVTKNHESRHNVQYCTVNGVKTPEFTIPELASLLSALELCVEADMVVPAANELTHTPPRTLH